MRPISTGCFSYPKSKSIYTIRRSVPKTLHGDRKSTIYGKLPAPPISHRSRAEYRQISLRIWILDHRK